MLGVKILGANLLKILSRTIGMMNVKVPSTPGLSNCLLISTRAFDSAARSLEKR